VCSWVLPEYTRLTHQIFPRRAVNAYRSVGISRAPCRYMAIDSVDAPSPRVTIPIPENTMRHRAPATHAHHDHDGVDRRGFLACMAWAGTGVVWAMSGGVPKAFAMDAVGDLTPAVQRSLFFAQISDSHIGFNKAANHDVTATMQLAVDRLNALPHAPALVLHTGDITQLSKEDEFDTAAQIMTGIKADRIFTVPGEHDVLGDNGAVYLRRFGRGSAVGWYSFNHSGVHFVGLVNVMDLQAGGLGRLGSAQLAWLKQDLRHVASSTPIVVFAHIPLWAVYPEWGWGTDDAANALTLLKRFGSVTVLNGHIHQTMQKIEGNVQFHTAMSTAFPQPEPGSAPSPGPLTVDAARLTSLLGTTAVTFVPGQHSLAIADFTLSAGTSDPSAQSARVAGEPSTTQDGAASAQAAAASTITIDNFQFSPKQLTVRAGMPIQFTNRDDVPHRIVSVDRAFSPSPTLDTDERFTVALTRPGVYPYFCSLHPMMTGALTVRAM
jgi:3',5'-cyclic-AMP phosphodiesterase